MIFSANVIHIAPWAVAEGLFAGANRHLRAGGQLRLYGPFRRDGAHNAPSNAAFDESLRRQNPEWGVRDTADLEKLALATTSRFLHTYETAVEQRDPGVRAVVVVVAIHRRHSGARRALGEPGIQYRIPNAASGFRARALRAAPE